ncbi:MAG: DNA gyrase subunit B [Planctomycetes bacterium]|nr:DNA gyrase subunit B [Planctomycetota bacterium]
MTATRADYTQDSIQAHQGLAHVRMRPAMYIGDVYERGLHHLVYEVVDNSVDEAMAGFCTRIDVTIHEDGSLTVLDDGRGIPVGIHKDLGIPAVEACLTELGVGGKFDKGSYQVSGGLHGVGVACVNALSEWLEVEVYREGKIHALRFARGATTKPLEVLGKSDRRGTKITFLPDNTIFKKSIEFSFEVLSKRLRELAYLNKGLQVTLRDERPDEDRYEEYCFPNGIVDFVNELSTSDQVLLDKPVYFTGSAESGESGGRVECEVAIQYNDTYSATLVSYANNIATIEGGTHLTGFRTALTTTLNNWLKENESQIKTKKSKDSDTRPSGDDYREGLIAVVSVKIPEPQFEGQTKTKLGNSDVAGIVQSVVGEYLKAWAEQNPSQTKKIVQKAMRAREARIAAKKAKELVRKTKDALRGGGIAKLKDANSNKAEECEIFLVEGDSAGGTAVTARNPQTQAILPLRGKILNVWKATHERMLGHNEISVIIRALGTGILDDFDITKLNYHKIIIMCDADVDGSHIRTLILTFLFRQMPELIQHGYVYVAQPPLYKIKRGEREEYLLTHERFEARTLEQGLEGSTLVRNADEAEFSGETLARIVVLLDRMNRLANEVEKKQVPFRKYLARRKDGKLPYARVVYPATKKAPAIYTEEDLDQHLKIAREDNLKVWSSTDPLEEREGADVEVVRFTNKHKLEKVLDELEQLGFGLEDYFAPQASDEWEREKLAVAPYVLKDKKHEEEVRGLCALPGAVRDLGQRGVRVQRYKGLGEMDDDELRETTMDPDTRQLLRVNLDDLSAANSIFSTLMGSNVEQRREFIEKHSHEVQSVDA